VITGAVVNQSAYSYDKSGNRTTFQSDLALQQASANTLNQLTQVMTGQGPLTVAGFTDKAATVTVNGVRALTYSDDTFRGRIPVTSGPNTIAITATDGDQNVNTKTWSVPILNGGTSQFSYDGDGNMLADGTHTFVYDSLDRITQVTWPDSQTLTISYDPLDRRMEEILKD
jgi:YD repeat-containing protein